MKYLYTIGFCLSGLTFMASCVDDQSLDFQVEKPAIIAMQEEINAYTDLNTYVNRDANPNFKLGAATTMATYNDMGVMHRLINSNFDEMTLQQGMTHGAVVQADGSLNLATLNGFLDEATEAGLSVYGQPLVWHTNQNAAYLRGLLAPLVIESPAYANSLDISGLEAEALEGWSYTGDVSVVENEGMGEGKAVKLVAGAGASAAEDLQLVSPEITVVPGHEYEVLFYIKSDAPGVGRVSFEGLTNNAPLIDWMNTGQASETFATSPGWQEVRFRVSDFEGESFKIKFDLGYASGVTYLLDIKNLYVYDTQGEPLVTNLVANGDFEAGTGWGGWGNSSERGVTEDGMGLNSEGKAFYVINPSLTGGFWEVQTSYDQFSEPIEQGETYNLSFWVKGSTTGAIRPELQSPDYSSDGFGAVYVTEEWQLVELSATATAADRSRLIFSYGEFAGTVYIDDVVLSNAAVSGGESTIVEKTPEEKEAIVSGQMEHWISGMVSSTKEHIKAWEVVKDPISDGNPEGLKTAGGLTPPSGVFYWQDYLGKDYGVMAFQLARQYGNENDLLFISDNRLESNLDKTRGLISYVDYIESNGATVDGIATQLNLSVTTDRANIDEMFTLLAATGKMIKISELQVPLAVAANEATIEDYQEQADLYHYVVNKYMELVPANQRYGITVWSPADDALGLWSGSGSFNRKPAYKSFADGLGGME